MNTVRSNGYSFQIELKYRACKLGFKHTEFPIIFDERRAGKSKMSGSIALEALWRVWGLRLFRKRVLREMNLPSRSVETGAESTDIRSAG